MTSMSETAAFAGGSEHGGSVRPRATMRDVAALAGVGVKTVSRVMNHEPNVSVDTIAKVQAAADSLHYRLDTIAGNLRRIDRRTGSIGLLVGNVANPFSGAIHRAVEDATHELGFAVFSASLDEDPQREQRLVQEFLKRRVDGLILTTISESQNYLEPELEHGMPMVFVDRAPRGLAADAIVSANLQGAEIATDHLITHGHRRIAFLGDRLEIATARLREEGFLRAMARAGIPASHTLVIDRLDNEQAARDAVARLMASDDPPTALFTAQNLITVGAIRALRALGAQHRVGLVGFDDVQLGDLLDPGITVVAQDPKEIGRLAAARLLARLGGERLPITTIEVPTTLIQRGSGEMRAP